MSLPSRSRQRPFLGCPARPSAWRPRAAAARSPIAQASFARGRGRPALGRSPSPIAQYVLMNAKVTARLRPASTLNSRTSVSASPTSGCMKHPIQVSIKPAAAQYSIHWTGYCGHRLRLYRHLGVGVVQTMLWTPNFSSYLLAREQGSKRFGGSLAFAGPGHLRLQELGGWCLPTLHIRFADFAAGRDSAVRCGRRSKRRWNRMNCSGRGWPDHKHEAGTGSGSGKMGSTVRPCCSTARTACRGSRPAYDRCCSGLSLWRKRFGESWSCLWPRPTVAHEAGALRAQNLKRVTVDTTVQPKAIPFQ